MCAYANVHEIFTSYPYPEGEGGRRPSGVLLAELEQFGQGVRNRLAVLSLQRLEEDVRRLLPRRGSGLRLLRQAVGVEVLGGVELAPLVLLALRQEVLQHQVRKGVGDRHQAQGGGHGHQKVGGVPHGDAAALLDDNTDAVVDADRALGVSRVVGGLGQPVVCSLAQTHLVRVERVGSPPRGDVKPQEGALELVVVLDVNDDDKSPCTEGGGETALHVDICVRQPEQ
mmetsp:Transcript_27088/g.84267  ORF Transcript_27088/g.84267 Transcript_27088/m.84267 type:complete len:227 (-) Transcript_27088:1054-1734(-)